MRPQGARPNPWIWIISAYREPFPATFTYLSYAFPILSPAFPILFPDFYQTFPSFIRVARAQRARSARARPPFGGGSATLCYPILLSATYQRGPYFSPTFPLLSTAVLGRVPPSPRPGVLGDPARRVRNGPRTLGSPGGPMKSL